MADSTENKKAATKSDIHTIPNPIEYLQFLGSGDNAGNTPIPSKVQDMFVHGMRELKTNVVSGKKNSNGLCTRSAKGTASIKKSSQN